MDPVQRAFSQALALLARHDYSTAGMLSRLERKGIPEDVREAVVERLTELGYLDDARVARQWAGAIVRSGRGFGPRLRYELGRRGISEEITAEVTTEIVAEHDAAELVSAIVRRRFPDFDPKGTPPKERGRIVAYLARRGFGLDVVMRVLQEYEGR